MAKIDELSMIDVHSNMILIEQGYCIVSIPPVRPSGKGVPRMPRSTS